MPLQNFDIQGHRGCRGLLPENTIPAMLLALEFEVTTLEMDVVITKDKQVVLSHEPYLSSKTCRDKKGKRIPKTKEKKYNIYEMTYKELKKYDCGTVSSSKFPNQLNVKTVKPLLTDVIDVVEEHICDNALPDVQFSIETKIKERTDNIFHPEPEEFVYLVLNAIRTRCIEEKTIIQSFDFRTLRLVKEKEPSIKIGLLDQNQNSAEYNIQQLGFKPDIYSPHYQKVTPSLVNYLHDQNIKVIPWTVNSEAAMRNLINMGVDGIISDYPNVLARVVRQGDMA